MREINRSVLIPKPREPFLDWVRSLEEVTGEVTLEQLREDCAALLVPEMEDYDDVDAFVEEYHGPLLEYLLAEWTDRDEAWPARRGLDMLREWFDFEVSTLALDVCDWALEHIEDDDDDDGGGNDEGDDYGDGDEKEEEEEGETTRA